MKNENCYVYASNVTLENCKLSGNCLTITATRRGLIEKYYVKVFGDLHVEAAGMTEVYLSTTYYEGEPIITIAKDHEAIVIIDGVPSRSATQATPTPDVSKIQSRIYRLYGDLENYEKRHCYGMTLSASHLRALAALVDEWDTPANVYYMVGGLYDCLKGWTGQDVAKVYFPPPWEDCHYLLEGRTHPIMKVLTQVAEEIQEGKFLVS